MARRHVKHAFRKRRQTLGGEHHAARRGSLAESLVRGPRRRRRRRAAIAPERGGGCRPARGGAGATDAATVHRVLQRQGLWQAGTRAAPSLSWRGCTFWAL